MKWAGILSIFAGIFSSIADGISKIINMRVARVILLFLGIFSIGGAICLKFGLAYSMAFSGLCCIGLSIYFERRAEPKTALPNDRPIPLEKKPLELGETSPSEQRLATKKIGYE